MCDFYTGPQPYIAAIEWKWSHISFAEFVNTERNGEILTWITKSDSFYFVCRKDQNEADNPTTTTGATDSSQQIMTGPGPPSSQAASSGTLNKQENF